MKDGLEKRKLWIREWLGEKSFSDVNYTSADPAALGGALIWASLGGAKCSISLLKYNCKYVFVLDLMFDTFYKVTKLTFSIALHRLRSR